jgi:hypothetical protein
MFAASLRNHAQNLALRNKDTLPYADGAQLL